MLPALPACVPACLPAGPAGTAQAPVFIISGGCRCLPRAAQVYIGVEARQNYGMPWWQVGLLIATYQGARALANSAIPLMGTVVGHALLATAGLVGYILHGVLEGSLGWFWASTTMIGGRVGGRESGRVGGREGGCAAAAACCEGALSCHCCCWGWCISACLRTGHSRS